VVRPYRPRYWLHVVLLIVTFFTMLVVGSRMEFNFLNGVPYSQRGMNTYLLPDWLGPGRSLSALAWITIRGRAHFHFAGARNGTLRLLPAKQRDCHASFFIPAPTLIGTLGAVIRIRSPIRTRTALFDIGIAGPIAGFVAAVGTLMIALTLSRRLRQCARGFKSWLSLIFQIVTNS